MPEKRHASSICTPLRVNCIGNEGFSEISLENDEESLGRTADSFMLCLQRVSNDVALILDQELFSSIRVSSDVFRIH